MRPFRSKKYPAKTRDARTDWAAEIESTCRAKIFFTPAKSYTTTAAAARLAQFNCASEVRFSIAITPSRSTPEAAGLEQLVSAIARTKRMIRRDADVLGLQNTRLARHQFFELRKLFHRGKRRIVLDLFLLLESFFQRLANILHRAIVHSRFCVRLGQVVMKLRPFLHATLLQ